MKHLLFIALVLVSSAVSAEGQIAALINFESTAARPDGSAESDNVTSILNANIEYILPTDISVYGGFSFILGESFESAATIGSRFYSSTPTLQIIPGAPMWAYIGGGMSFFNDIVYYPEAGFRTATSDSSRLDVYIKILNSSDKTYNQHVLIGAGLTF